MAAYKEERAGVLADLEAVDKLVDVRDQFIVDAGCGNMRFSQALAERGAHVLAIDPDPVQAALNRKAPVIPNVGFSEGGAERIPVETHSVDGIFFPHSLHHVPAALYTDVFNEALRVLRPDGYLFVLEPVAEGELNEVMRLFHDEKKVREQAQQALDSLAVPCFTEVQVLYYSNAVSYASWDDYAQRYAGKSYNTNYTAADVMAEPVRQRFMELGQPRNFMFEVPKKITLLRTPIASSVPDAAMAVLPA